MVSHVIIGFFLTAKAESQEVVKAVSRQIDVFSVMKIWVSDQGFHYKNRAMEILSGQFYVKHHFVTAYVSWSNGPIERCC